MQFQIEVLAPLHIGCGESYSGLNYLIEKGKIYYFEPDRLIKALGDNVGAYVNLLEKNSYQLCLKRFCQNNHIRIRELRSKAAYCLTTKTRVFDSINIIHKFISQSHCPYLPGTEIKGAMRTALLYDRLQKDKNLYQWLIGEIKNFGKNFNQYISQVKNKKRAYKIKLNNEMKGIAKKLEQRAFNIPDKLDAKYDILKYLFISDSELRKPPETLTVTCSEPINTGKHFKVFHEYVKPGVKFDFPDLSIRQHDLHRAKLAFSDKQNQLLRIDTILECCHRFSQALLDHEIDYFENKNQPDIINQLTLIANQNRSDSPVIRIGKDQGYLSTTMGMLVKQNDPQLYEDIFIHAAKGTSYDAKHGGPSPKSRKIVTYNNKKLTSGWVKILRNDNSGTPQKTRKKAKEDTKPPTQEDLQKLMQKWGKE